MIVLSWVSIATVVFVLFAAAAALWVVYAPVAARGLADMPYFPSGLATASSSQYTEGMFNAEEVTFNTADGLELEGTYLPTTAPQRKGVVVFCHELRGSRRTAFRFTDGLRDQGFDVLTFDFRNHGSSAVKSGYRPIPWATHWEAADVRAAIDFCCRRDASLAGRVVLFGLSRGATAALYVAAFDSRVRAAVLDSMVPTELVQIHLIRRFMHIHARSLPLLSKLPDWLLGVLAFWANRIMQRQRGGRILRINRAAQRLRKPVLMIHGGRDAFSPSDAVRTLWARMRNHPRLWVISQAKHNEAILKAGEGYHRRVARFLTHRLDGPMDDPVSLSPGNAKGRKAEAECCAAATVSYGGREAVVLSEASGPA